MSRLLRLLLPTLLACAGRPTEQGAVNATLDGNVFVTGPVEGVVVSAYALDLDDGAQGSLIAQSMETDDHGAYHLDLGTYHGPLLLVAQGVGGTYIEPATAITAHWDASTQLRAVFAAGTPNRDIRLALDTGEEGTAVITPWSEWAFAYSFARHAAARDRAYADALTHAIQRFRDHVELDFWNVVPTVMSDGAVGAWNNGVQAGLLLSSLSKLTAEMASDSQLSMAGLSSLELVAAVRDDLSDAQAVLDGAGTQGELKVGSCTNVCVLSPFTLRANLRNAAADFLASSANTSGITVTDAAELLGRISARVSDLWPTVPIVTILPSSFRDDSGVNAGVEGPGVGVAQYENQGTPIALAAGESPSFVKFASRYAADSENLPEWHFAVSDNSGDPEITLSARLSRLSAQGALIGLKDWFTVTPVAGSGYNRALTISSALHPDIAVVSGTYILEYRATNALGNASLVDCGRGLGCVKWSQVILPPPLRQRQGTGGDICADPAIPTAHVLGVAGPCPGLNNTASMNLNGPDSRRIAQGYIDNPNPVSVQVVISASAPSYIRRGLRFANIQVADPTSVNRACDETGIEPVTPTGECYDARPNTSEYGTEDVLDRDLATDISVAGATALGMDAAGRQVYQIAPRSTARVSIQSSPWRFLMPSRPRDYAALGALEFVTGYTGNDWLRCVRVFTPRYGEGFGYCTDQVRVSEFTQLTRVTVHPRSSVTLTARPAGSEEATWVPAIGTSVAGFGYTDFTWDTKASGY